jgi:ethanolamine utilization protein EutS
MVGLFSTAYKLLQEEPMSENKLRTIQEYVPGKQVTLAHIIRNPRPSLCEKIGIDNRGAIGILTITPGEASMIAADVATKSAVVEIEFVDRFTGCVMISGDVSAVENALKSVVSTLKDILSFTPAEVTRS